MPDSKRDQLLEEIRRHPLVAGLPDGEEKRAYLERAENASRAILEVILYDLRKRKKRKTGESRPPPCSSSRS